MNLREQYEMDYVTALWAALESKPVHDIGYSSPESEWMPVNKERLTAAVAALPQLLAESRSSWVSCKGKTRLTEEIATMIHNGVEDGTSDYHLAENILLHIKERQPLPEPPVSP